MEQNSWKCKECGRALVFRGVLCPPCERDKKEQENEIDRS